jgi:hypothetical protein
MRCSVDLLILADVSYQHAVPAFRVQVVHDQLTRLHVLEDLNQDVRPFLTALIEQKILHNSKFILVYLELL